MKKLRVGVVGLGMGRNHISGYQAHPAAQVVALADPDPKRLAAIGDQYQVPGRYADAAAMLKAERLDVVSVATPNKFHKPLAIAALRAGCHVLCEKPMAMNAGEARAMLAAARTARRRIMINFSYRFTGPAIALKREAEAGVLGDVYFARTMWHRSRGIPGFGGWFGQKALSGGGPLIDLGVHRIDLALWLMGYPKPVWVTAGTYDAIGRRLAREAGKRFDVEDLATGFVRFANGATLAIEASWAVNRPEAESMETRLYGTRGGMVHHNVNQGYEFEGEVYTEQGGKVVARKAAAVHPPRGGAMHHFIDAIVRRRPHMADGADGLTVMRLLDAIYASARRGAPVRVG